MPPFESEYIFKTRDRTFFRKVTWRSETPLSWGDLPDNPTGIERQETPRRDLALPINFEDLGKLFKARLQGGIVSFAIKILKGDSTRRDTATL